MDFQTLLQKQDALLAENKALREENLSLKIRLGLAEPFESQPSPDGVQENFSPVEPSLHLDAKADPAENPPFHVAIQRAATTYMRKDGKARTAPSLDTHLPA